MGHVEQPQPADLSIEFLARRAAQRTRRAVAEQRRDRGRARCFAYTAEDVAAAVYPPLRGKTYRRFRDLEWRCIEILTDPWFTSRWPHVGGFTIFDTGETGRGASCRAPARGTPPIPFRFRFSAGFRSEQTIIHEIAHAASWVPRTGRRRTEPGHGPRFARNYVALVEHYIDPESADVLASAMRSVGLLWSANATAL